MFGIHLARLSPNRPSKQSLGTRAPIWINDNDVTRCQICHNRFRTNFIAMSRRHHCRSCGRCICGSCSTKKFILKYCNRDGEQRICDTCYTYFTDLKKPSFSFPKITRFPDRSILFGNFRLITHNSIVWIDLTQDFYLHIYPAKLDRVSDYSIHLTELRELTFNRDKRKFTLILTKDRTYKFLLEPNHHITYQTNDDLDDKLRNTTNRLLFYANLWHDSMQLARSRVVPLWYIKKRESVDSGFCANE